MSLYPSFLVRSCYNIFMVDENGVVRARKKERDTQGNFPNP